MSTRLQNAVQLPLIITPESSGFASDQLLSTANKERSELRHSLLRHGALLFRGFAPLDIASFASFARSIARRDLLDYVGGASPRTRLGHGVYTSTEYPSEYSLSLHNELSYTSRWPELLFFYCVTAARQGGETTLGDSRSILRSIDPNIVERFKKRGLTYIRNLEDHLTSPYSWQAAFETNDRRFVEKYCDETGMSWKWLNDGGLELSESRPATAVHPATGEEVWFNQADGFHPSASGLDPNSKDVRLRLNVFFADDSPIPLSDLDAIRGTIQSEMILVEWKDGDVLVVDNMLACHGRMPFTGPRKVLLAMA